MIGAIGGSINMFGRGPSGAQSNMSNHMQGALDYFGRMRNNNGRSLIGGGNRSGVASVTADNQAGGFAATTPATPGLGAGGFAVAPAAAAPELAAETISGDLGAMAAAAVTPDPYNNAARTPQQDAVGQIQGNAFMRQQSMQGLV
tara:strand:+ start:1375 stop:1809 length:435 start_codon:yes stop_codon:yes gene_type:complete